MTTKVQGIDSKLIRQSFLIEEPALEISSESMNQKDRLFAFSPLYIA